MKITLPHLFSSYLLCFTSIKEFPLDEFFQAERFQPDPDEPCVVLLQDWLQSGYLLRGQPTEWSSEAAEEDYHASVRLPQVSIFHRLYSTKEEPEMQYNDHVRINYTYRSVWSCCDGLQAGAGFNGPQIVCQLS